jgi:hypothetical protein
MNAVNISVVTWMLIKGMALLGLFIYMVFAGILVRQEHLMTKVMEESSEPLLRILVLTHFIGAIIVFITAIILL